MSDQLLKKFKKDKKLIDFFFFLRASAFWTNSFAKIVKPVTFLLYALECKFFLNDVDIQLILELKNSFGKICPVLKP